MTSFDVNFDELPIEIRHGHEVRPCAEISQALWFSIQHTKASQSHIWSTSYFWIEYTAGQIEVARVSGRFSHPEIIIPSLARGVCVENRKLTIGQRIRSGWLFPPMFTAEIVSESHLSPTKDFILGAIKEYLFGVPCFDKLFGLLSDVGDKSPRMAMIQLSNGRQLEVEVEEVVMNGGVFQRRLFEKSYDSNDVLPSSIALWVNACRHPKYRLQVINDFPWIVREIEFLPLSVCDDRWDDILSWVTTGRHPQYRMQAITAFPWIIPVLEFLPLSVGEAIDAGHSVLRTFAQYYSVQSHTIRRLPKRSFLGLDLNQLAELDLVGDLIRAILCLIDGMKPDHQPKICSKDFDFILNIGFWILWHLRLDEDSAFIKRLSAELFNNGVKCARRLLRRLCPTHNEEDPFDGITDFILCRTMQNIGPNEPISCKLIGNLFKEMVCADGLKSAFVASELWHVQQWERENGAEKLSWPALLGSPMAVEKLFAYELTDSAMLLEEGRVMRHCVFSHASLCASGNNFIYSLRATDGKRKGTVHIEKNDNKLSIIEHKAYANGSPDLESRAAANQLLEFLHANVPAPPST